MLTLEALVSAAPVRSFVRQNADRIALVALSDPFRAQASGRTWKILRRTGLALLPYLAANFVVSRISGRLRRRNRASPPRENLRELCADRSIPITTAGDMNSEAFRGRLRASGADILVIFHCDQILTAETLHTLPLGGVNVHAGLLPDHRGPVPTIHAMLERPARFGVTIHRLVTRIDAGAILAQASLELPARSTALEAALRLHEAAVPMLADVLDRLADGTVCERRVEPGAYCGFPTRAQLQELKRSGARVADWRDIRRAWRTPV